MEAAKAALDFPETSISESAFSDTHRSVVMLVSCLGKCMEHNQDKYLSHLIDDCRNWNEPEYLTTIFT